MTKHVRFLKCDVYNSIYRYLVFYSLPWNHLSYPKWLEHHTFKLNLSGIIIRYQYYTRSIHQIHQNFGESDYPELCTSPYHPCMVYITYIWLVFRENVGIYPVHGWRCEDVSLVRKTGRWWLERSQECLPVRLLGFRGYRISFMPWSLWYLVSRFLCVCVKLLNTWCFPLKDWL